MSSTRVHIINHTHWDREWFLTSIYTSQWIPDLIDRLEQLVAQNPNFKYLLDGQTLVIEDLLKIAPEYNTKIEELISNGNLIIGPYYCQPDWQLTGGESLIRNFLYGWQDMEAYGTGNGVGWLVDTFGHISQAPQLHRLFNLEALFVWRGVPQLEPYFHWQGADGQQLFTVNLFSGYRNLYGVTHVPEVAIKRLEAEVAKLRPFYPTDDVPLFDGYDLEQNPEDPIRFYQKRTFAIPKNIHIEESSPHDYVRVLRDKLHHLPIIHGELNSGKYGATFPGTLSTRTYIKIMNRDCEHLLYGLCEPLAVLARLKGRDYNGQQYETWGRMLLQNSVHDCICGVSIDQVHEKMEYSYNTLFEAARQDIRKSLDHILKDFAPGVYAVSTNPFTDESWYVVQDNVCHVHTYGIGVWKIEHQEPVEKPNKPVEGFDWRNDYYSATIMPDGAVQMGKATLGYLVVTEERGDTYSDETGDRRSICKANGPLIVEQECAHYCVVRYDCSLFWDKVKISATVRLTFDQTPLLRWQVDLDSEGTNFRVEMVFETAQPGEIYAGMPFDVVKRPSADRDLLPPQLDDNLAKVLLGQRELNEVKTFPFQDFVAVSDGNSSAVVFAKGIRSYQAENNGTISLTLRRSVEWLIDRDLKYRAGDAGPLMYVPDARCERVIKHEIAVMISRTAIDDMTISEFNAGFQNPPVIVDSHSSGEQTAWQVLQENLPLSGLHIYDQKVLARFYNPTTKEQAFEKVYLKTDVRGNPEAPVKEISAKEIATIQMDEILPMVASSPGNQPVTPIIWPLWRVGENHGRPDSQIIEQLGASMAKIETQLVQIEEELKLLNKNNQYSLQHTYYVLKRELYELRLSAFLNESKLAAPDGLSYEYLYTPDLELARLGLELNELRIKRRIYDYVVEAWTGQEMG
jgi:alpha-mannosidase